MKTDKIVEILEEFKVFEKTLDDNTEINSAIDHHKMALYKARRILAEQIAHLYSAGEEVKQIKWFVEFNLSESAKEENWESELFAKGWIAALMHVKVNCLDKLPLPYPTVSEDEIGAEILPYLIEFDPYVDWSELLDRLSKAIKELLNR